MVSSEKGFACSNHNDKDMLASCRMFDWKGKPLSEVNFFICEKLFLVLSFKISIFLNSNRTKKVTFNGRIQNLLAVRENTKRSDRKP